MQLRLSCHHLARNCNAARGSSVAESKGDDTDLTLNVAWHEACSRYLSLRVPNFVAAMVLETFVLEQEPTARQGLSYLGLR